MKKFLTITLAAALAAGLMTGCASSNDNAASSDVGEAQGSGEEIETDYGTVILADMDSLTADKYIYTVSEEDIDDAVEELLYDYIDYEEVDRPAKEGDYVLVSYFKATIDGEVYEKYKEDDEYEIPLDGEYYGTDFDDQVIGASVGDELSFSVTYSDDFDDMDFAGNTVEYEMTIAGISEEIIPELTEKFVQDELGYDSEEAMREELKTELEEMNEEDSESEYRDNLMEAYIERCTFTYYDEEVYDAYYDDAVSEYEEYLEWFGFSDLEELYEAFGMTEADVEEEALDTVYRVIVVDAIVQRDGIEVSDELFDEKSEEIAEENDYDSAEELLEENDEETILYMIQEGLVLDMLEEHATPNEIEYNYDDEE